MESNHLLNFFTKKKWIGQRIIKTGVAVFFTALICITFQVSAVFAVITAIVTLEPTASESIKKGVIRLPASAIGAALSVFFVSVFGYSAITFALAATLTIFLCQKLKLEQGTLVATLTAVAMIPNIHDHFLLAFLTRVGTTTIGLTVSTLVNIFLFPPKYISTIADQIKEHQFHISKVLKKSMEIIISTKKENNSKLPLESYQILRSNIDKTEELVKYQKAEWRYHRMKYYDYRHFFKLKKKLMIIQKILLHLGNLQYIKSWIDFTEFERELLVDTTASIVAIIENIHAPMSDDHFYNIYELDQYLKYEYSSGHRRDPAYFHHFHEKTIVFYELLSIHDSLEELRQLVGK
ncbi:FUSC family protein [Evansella cellulosilytica]|uniref:Integral membrane protein n=1 Tax=Evansella cellulosilytica (strain ATCC 21833 / DSM 2522 / FERM P-1141 / JCM 9156 / N-4) TaxID=649639 RepID=E6U0A9_EVAC2|nr:aromatic acid exporter family protein [Evansella cellulosilytica]ADU30225.1 integral membrane protein [Evansella cellulosilytica DSM 2522]